MGLLMGSIVPRTHKASRRRILHNDSMMIKNKQQRKKKTSLDAWPELPSIGKACLHLRSIWRRGSDGKNKPKVRWCNRGGRTPAWVMHRHCEGLRKQSIHLKSCNHRMAGVLGGKRNHFRMNRKAQEEWEKGIFHHVGGAVEKRKMTFM